MDNLVVHKTNLQEIVPGYATRGEVFRVKEVKLKKTAKNKDFYSVTLMNKLGSNTVNIWDPGSIIYEGNFLEMYMTGDEHSRFGKQWKVKMYSKSSYSGDDGFNDQEEVLDIQALTDRIQGYAFIDPTMDSLYRQFLKESFSLTEEPDFTCCPADKNYYKQQHGLLVYTKNMLSFVDSLTLCPFINDEFIRIAALLHHAGSLNCYNLATNGNYCVPNEVGILSSPHGELNNVLEDLRIKAQHFGNPVDGTMFKAIQAISNSAFTNKPICEESLVLINFRNIVLGMEKLHAVKKENPGVLLVPHLEGYILNTDKLFEEDTNGYL